MKDMIQKFKENFKKKNLIHLIILTVLFFIGARVAYTNEIIPRMTDAYTENAISTNDDTSVYALTEGEVINQNFIYPKDQMIAIGVALYSDTSDNEGNLTLRIYDDSTGSMLGENSLDASTIINMKKNQADAEDIAYLNVNMGGLLSGYEGQQLRAELTVDELGDDTSVFIYANPYDAENGYEAAQITGSDSGDISIIVRAYCYQYGYWKWYYRGGCTVLFLMMLLCYFEIFIFDRKLHRVFLIAGTTFAICYTFLIPPVTVPDEMNHYATAYYYSNAIMGVDEPVNDTTYKDNDSIYIRKTDMDVMAKLQTTPTLKEYDYITWNILRKPAADGGELVVFNKSKESNNWTLYIPGIVGITLGRLTGMNGVTTIYFGRLLAVLLYLAFFYYVIKKVPLGKAAVFLFALCPMVLQQCCSYSYDAIPIEVSALLFAELFSILYEDRQVEKKDMILLGILTFFLASCKGGVYIPECLFVLLIPADKFANKTMKKRVMLLLLVTTLAGFLINTLPYLLQVLGVTQAATATQTYSESLDCYSISDVLFHPVHSIYVVINTLLMYVDYYLEGMFAGPLGWLNIAINPFWAYAMLALMFFGITTIQGYQMQITRKHKIVYGIGLLLTFAMSIASMFVSWTTSGNTTVSGIQGRYFTPVFLYLLFLFRGRFIMIRKNIDKELAFLGLGLGVIIVNNILSSIQTVM